MPAKEPISKMDAALGGEKAQEFAEKFAEEMEQEVRNVADRQAAWSDTVDLPAEKLQIPYLSLMQGLSKPVLDEKAKMGDWYVEGYEATKSVTIVPLKFGVGRTFMLNVDGKNQTACYSPTGREHGIAMTTEGPGIECSECPLKDWTPSGKFDANGNEKNNPPVCKESFDFLAWCVDYNSFVKASFRGTGAKTGRFIATLGRTNGLGQFAIKLSSVKATNPNGQTYSVPAHQIVSGEGLESILGTAQAMLAIE